MCIPSPKSPPSKNPNHRSKVLAILAAFGGSMWRPLPGRTDEVAQPRNDGNHNDKDIHRPPQTRDPPLTPTQGTTEVVKAPNPTHFIQVPPLTSPPTRTIDLSTISVSLRFGLRGLDAFTIGQVAREDHSATKAKASSLKHMQRRKPTTPTLAPSTPPLIVPPGNGTGSTPPSDEEPQ